MAQDSRAAGCLVIGLPVLLPCHSLSRRAYATAQSRSAMGPAVISFRNRAVAWLLTLRPDRER